MKTVNDALRHRLDGARPRSTRQLSGRIPHEPPGSVVALLRKAGPFVAARDGYVFSNGADGGWPITDEDAAALREHYQRLVEPVSVLGIAAVRHALGNLVFKVPAVGAVGLPIALIDLVVARVAGDLKNQLLDAVIAAVPGRFGRCGGMAFSALDFFLAGWPVNSFTIQPAAGNLRRYIWTRLLDSLDANALPFFQAIMVIHVLPVISKAASAVLAGAVGSIGGPLGAVVAAFMAGKTDVLGIGGPDAMLEPTRQEWARLQARLDGEAAWPIGLVYGGQANPIDQHQVLATRCTGDGAGTATLELWDNNDGNAATVVTLDFKGPALQVTDARGKVGASIHQLKAILCEDYVFKMPPASLRVA